MTTSNLPAALMPSTMARPSLPVPPATATVGISKVISRCGNQVLETECLSYIRTHRDLKSQSYIYIYIHIYIA